MNAADLFPSMTGKSTTEIFNADDLAQACAECSGARCPDDIQTKVSELLDTCSCRLPHIRTATEVPNYNTQTHTVTLPAPNFYGGNMALYYQDVFHEIAHAVEHELVKRPEQNMMTYSIGEMAAEAVSYAAIKSLGTTGTAPLLRKSRNYIAAYWSALEYMPQALMLAMMLAASIIRAFKSNVINPTFLADAFVPF